MTILDSSALLIAGGDGLAATQARLTYRMGLRLLKDLTHALGIQVDLELQGRMTEANLPAIIAAAEASGFPLTFGPGANLELLRLVRRFDVYLIPLAQWLVISLPPWISLERAGQDQDHDKLEDGGNWFD
jgi:hypothetical protein